MELLGQAVALADVEEGEAALEEGHGLGLLARLGRAFALLAGHEAVGIEDAGAVLALADGAAQVLRLAEGEPGLRREAVLDDGAPEDEDVDLGIAAARRGVLRQPEPGLGPAPGLHPEHAALLQARGQDAAGRNAERPPG